MIQTATAAQKQELIALYNHSFANDEKFCQWFFNNAWQAENCLVYVQNNSVCAMLNMMEYQIQSGDEVQKNVYFFALATSKTMQGKGIMSTLIKHALEVCKNNNVNAATLIVQTESLFNFYEKQGFVKAVYVSQEKCEPQELPKGYTVCKLTNENCETANFIYEDTLKNTAYAKRSKDFWNKIFQVYGTENYLLLKNNLPNAYCIGGIKTNKCITFAECMGSGSSILMGELARANEVPNVVYTSQWQKNNSVAIGCIYSLNKNFTSTQKIFLNLMYN